VVVVGFACHISRGSDCQDLSSLRRRDREVIEPDEEVRVPPRCVGEESFQSSSARSPVEVTVGMTTACMPGNAMRLWLIVDRSLPEKVDSVLPSGRSVCAGSPSRAVGDGYRPATADS
jgi:hypothetical protein